MSTTLEHVTTAAENHHDELRDRLAVRVELLLTAVVGHRPHEAAREDLVTFLREELLAHTEVEEGLLYSAGDRGPTALLVAAMQDEHRMLATLAAEIERATDPMEVVLAAGALVVLFDVCVHQENRYLLPALAEAGVDLGTLLGRVPEVVGDGTGERW